jgi:transposase InsO family protein
MHDEKLRISARRGLQLSTSHFFVTYVDNGPEFHGEALTRGCREYGIRSLHRPVARP